MFNPYGFGPGWLKCSIVSHRSPIGSCATLIFLASFCPHICVGQALQKHPIKSQHVRFNLHPHLHSRLPSGNLLP